MTRGICGATLRELTNPVSSLALYSVKKCTPHTIPGMHLPACSQLDAVLRLFAYHQPLPAPPPLPPSAPQAQLQDTAARLHVAKQECLLTMMAVHVSARDGARALQCYQAAARDLPHPAAADSHIAGSGGGGDGGSGGGGAEGGVSNGLKQVPEGLLGGASCLALKVTALALAQRLQVSTVVGLQGERKGQRGGCQGALLQAVLAEHSCVAAAMQRHGRQEA